MQNLLSVSGHCHQSFACCVLGMGMQRKRVITLMKEWNAKIECVLCSFDNCNHQGIFCPHTTYETGAETNAMFVLLVEFLPSLRRGWISLA